MPDLSRNRIEHSCKEAVCIDAGRVYDSCADKDCYEDLPCYFTERDQMVIDRALNVRAKKAEVLTTYIDVEPLPFNSGYFTCDLTFFFEVECEVTTGRNMPNCTVCGICIAQKKVILYGSEGSVKVFSSEVRTDASDRQEMPTSNMPRCTVQVAEPIVLGSRLVDACDWKHKKCGCGSIPDSIASRFGGAFTDPEDGKLFLVTLGVFCIVQLSRNVQMLVPVFDFCLPSRDCEPSDNPCDMFRKMQFPVDAFFPPEDVPSHCKRPV